MRPERHVEVHVDGSWWPGVQHGWRMYADGTGWRAAVRLITPGPDGLGSRDVDVPVTSIRELTASRQAR
jgi:hypothetical protein